MSSSSSQNPPGGKSGSTSSSHVPAQPKSGKLPAGDSNTTNITTTGKEQSQQSQKEQRFRPPYRLQRPPGNSTVTSNLNQGNTTGTVTASSSEAPLGDRSESLSWDRIAARNAAA